MLKGIISDIKFIINFIRKGKKGEQILDPVKVNAFREAVGSIRPRDFFNKITGVWVFAVLFALFIGIFLGAKYYEVQCNNFIIENYVDKNYGKPRVGNLSNMFINSSSVFPLVTEDVDKYSKAESDYYNQSTH